MDLENRFGCWTDDQLNPIIGFVDDSEVQNCSYAFTCINRVDCVKDNLCLGLYVEKINE